MRTAHAYALASRPLWKGGPSPPRDRIFIYIYARVLENVPGTGDKSFNAAVINGTVCGLDTYGICTVASIIDTGERACK